MAEKEKGSQEVAGEQADREVEPKKAGGLKLILKKRLLSERFHDLAPGDEIPPDHELYGHGDQMVLWGQAEWMEKDAKVSREAIESGLRR